MTLLRTLVCLGLLASGAAAAGTVAAPPVLYSQGLYESPVAGEADDLLFLAGTGLAPDDTVEVRRSDGTGQIVDVVGRLDAPDALTVRLPAWLADGEVVSLQARDASGHASAPVTINDPRPLWFTPQRAYATQALAGLPRELRVVGRNLRVPSGGSGRVRLEGPARFDLPVLAPGPDDRAFSQHVAVVALPAELAPGHYTLSFSSRDAAPFLAVPGSLDVQADRPPRLHRSPATATSDACRPDDDADDTACLERAIAGVAAAGGGVVDLPAGTWDLSGNPSRPQGMVLPDGVDLQGAGAASTRLRRHPGWRAGTADATFTLLGHNNVEGIGFVDLRAHRAGDPKSPMLRLGPLDDGTRERNAASDIVISHSAFDQAHPAIADGGVPLSRIVLSYNLFGAWSEAIDLSGNRYNVRRPFRLDDSIIRYNLFLPGGYLDVAARQGAMASEIGASERLDFSDNIANGANTGALREGDAPGWRAAFFWHMNNSHERLLVARNQVSCAGDKVGDGEAIAFDNNANTFALREPALARRAGTDWVEIDGPLSAVQNGRPVDKDYYARGHWVQVVTGPGLGQSRRIVGVDAQSQGRVRVRVSPPWDVAPQAAQSSVLVGRVFWQAMVLDNVIDQRQPLCRKSNRSNTRGGLISIWAPTSASVVQGNLQYDTDGITFQQHYHAAGAGCAACTSELFSQYFLDIRDNRVDGEVDWDSDCSASGIQGSHSAGAVGVPPTVAFGVSISHNRVRRADGLRGGAISEPLSWLDGPAPHDWPLVRGTLIHHNRLVDLQGPGPRRACATADGAARTGIVLSQGALVHHSVLYANACDGTRVPLRDAAGGSTLLCAADVASACECAAP